MLVQCAKIGSDDVVGTILHDNNVCFPMAKYPSLIDTCGQHSHIFCAQWLCSTLNMEITLFGHNFNLQGIPETHIKVTHKECFGQYISVTQCMHDGFPRPNHHPATDHYFFQVTVQF